MFDTQRLQKREGRQREAQDIADDLRQLAAVPEPRKESEAIRQLEEDVKVRYCLLMEAVGKAAVAQEDAASESGAYRAAIGAAIGGDDKLREFIRISK